MRYAMATCAEVIGIPGACDIARGPSFGHWRGIVSSSTAAEGAGLGEPTVAEVLSKNLS